ncbi:hypothetical protein KUTeg_008102 [Tegillarca granosa]|uniref:Uncharacterized protein n=1 Tax=Tegillarca granosa TaxID=220873 RepID=A0ABQ9FBA9_TEGGR|nr:hypothetical protein KUTeg_008102 [Tegillarca granosa]
MSQPSAPYPEPPPAYTPYPTNNQPPQYPPSQPQPTWQGDVNPPQQSGNYPPQQSGYQNSAPPPGGYAYGYGQPVYQQPGFAANTYQPMGQRTVIVKEERRERSSDTEDACLMAVSSFCSGENTR